jgi:mannose-6-phosphate isomerase
MVWGGRRLGALLGKPLPTEEAYGESWDVSDHPLHRSIVAGGPFAGQSLRYLMEHHREALLGPAAARYTTFPWLVKFLDCHDWLSVQVHPDETAVKRLWPGEGGKTEAWFVLDAQPGSAIYAGLLPGVDQKRLRAAVADGTVAACLHRFEPRPGDCVLLRAGTVHAVGGGVLLAEVQQTSDATFRLFDWNRRDAQGKSRSLHLEQSLAALHWDYRPVQPVRAEGFADSRGVCIWQPLVKCRYFSLEYVHENRPFAVGGSGALQSLLVLKGQSRLGEDELAVGQAWVLPAAMPRVECRPQGQLGVLLCTLP